MYTNYCPDCGQLLYDRETEKPWEIGKSKDCEMSLTSQYKRILHCNNEVRKWNDVAKEWEIVPCNALLMTYVPYSYGGRWPVCKYLREFYTDHYCAIIDESHEAKGLDTNIGAASQDLIQGALHAVAMTGTESNGYTKSVFSTLFRLDWRFRELYGYHDQQLFVDHYGMVETRTVIPSEKSRTSGAGYSSSVSVTKDEMPGASPALIKLMAPLTAWVSMEDMGIALPPRLEYVVPVEMTDEQSEGWSVLDRMKLAAIRMYLDGNQGPMSRWLGAAKAWLDCPNDEELKSLGKLEKLTPPEGGFPKDQQIVNMVLENLNEDRGCCVFCEQVNRRDFRPRLIELLKDAGVHTAVINRDDAPPDGRMELIRSKVKELRRKGQEPVMLLNGSLVKVGVELLDFPTMIETGIEFNVLTLQQRARRAWRIGQNREVRIYYLYYADTYQEDALLLVASKLAAMASLKGNVATGLAAMSGTSSAIQALLRSANEMDHRSLADMMQTATFNKRPILRSPIVNSAPQEIVKPEARILVPPTEIKVSSLRMTDTVEQLALF
jgi:hypothetical protein